jgi:hypothetical protein
MAVEHGGLEVEVREELEDGPGEKTEPLEIVGIIPGRGAVKIVAVEKAVVFHEENREPGRIHQAEKAGLFRPRPDPDLELAGKRLEREPFFPDFPVEGENDSDFLL